MKEQSGLKISKKSFIASFSILFVLMIFTGILTKVIRPGIYQRMMVDGRESVIAGSFQYINPVDYPFYRWFLAPIEVLKGSDSLTIIIIILFILLIGSSFVILDKSGILRFIMESIVRRFENRKYLLMGILILFFMLFGSLFGIFEELIVLVPMAITLSYSFGWDSLVGLGISAMASGFGFAAAIFNPFTLGVAQKLAELPAYSGTGYRILIFITIYLVLYAFLFFYAKKIEKNPELSPVYDEDRSVRKKYVFEGEYSVLDNPRLKQSVKVYLIFMGIMVATIMSGFFINAISEITLPLVALIFFAAGLTAGVISGYQTTELIKDIFKGLLTMLPAVVLILMAMSIKHIMISASTMDTILYRASGSIGSLSPNIAVIFLYLMILFMDFFIGSGSAKAFLVMPIIIPLTDMIGVTRQTAVLAYCFGDGFSNLLFPTNPTLMIALGLTVVSYPKWIKWSIKIQLVIFVITTAILFVANRFGFGPF